MPSIAKFRSLGARERALVAVAVLLDGHDATEYLACDRNRAAALVRAARDFASFCDCGVRN